MESFEGGDIMALYILMIIVIIMGSLLLATIFAAFFSKGKLQKNKVFLYLTGAFILLITFFAITTVPNNYVFHKIISILLAFGGLVGIYLARFKSSNYKIVGFLLTLSLMGNFYIAFLR